MYFVVGATRRILFARCAGLLLLAGIHCANATDYASGFNVITNARHDDNIRLVERDKTAISGVAISPTFNFDINSETSNAELLTTFTSSRYNDSGFNSDDAIISASATHSWERATLGLSLQGLRNSTTTSELTDSGRIGTQADRHEHYQATPSFSYHLSERDIASVQAAYSVDDYGDASYTGYKYGSANLNWIHQLNDRIQLVLRGTYSNYRTDSKTVIVPVYTEFNFGGTPLLIPLGSAAQETSTHSVSRGGMAGFYYSFSENKTLNLLYGRSITVTDYPLRDSLDICGRFISPLCNQAAQHGNSSNAEIDWTWQGERQQISLSGTKNTQPSSDGNPLDSTQIGIDWNFQLTEFDQVAANLTAIRNRVASSNSLNTAANSDRDYGSATLQYKHQFSESWFLDSSYQYRYQTYKQIDYQASSRVLSLGIRYQPQQWHWSR